MDSPIVQERHRQTVLHASTRGKPNCTCYLTIGPKISHILDRSVVAKKAYYSSAHIIIFFCLMLLKMICSP